jgi:integrase
VQLAGSTRSINRSQAPSSRVAAAPITGAAPHGLAIRRRRGHPAHQNTIGQRWRTTLARASVPPFRLHDLRHFFASALIAAGCDVVTV